MPTRVLIIEDEVLIAEFTEDMVRELGYEVAASVYKKDLALEAIRKNDFDLAAIDMSMEGKDCPEIPDSLIELEKPFAL